MNIKSRARSASDLYSYNRPTNSELLFNNSRKRADLFVLSIWLIVKEAV